MINNDNKWVKLGRLLSSDKDSKWIVSHVGASCVRKINTDKYEVYFTGRDIQNRSVICRSDLSFEGEEFQFEFNDNIVFGHGELGAFDENGVSYPYIVDVDSEVFMYYVGWMPTVLTPFQNHLGLAKLDGSTFKRVSRAPIMERNNEDYLSMGSACVIIEEGVWKMWYTSFVRWEKSNQNSKHSYVIKYATSKDGISWNRNDVVCIKPIYDGEHSIGRPSVVKHGGKYHMWFCYRGDDYKIGYAYSDDGISWTRSDENTGVELSSSGWDSKGMAYPYVFQRAGRLYMIYCGNRYGEGGMGLAVLELDKG